MARSLSNLALSATQNKYRPHKTGVQDAKKWQPTVASSVQCSGLYPHWINTRGSDAVPDVVGSGASDAISIATVRRKAAVARL
jgi:hypothetical protein